MRLMLAAMLLVAGCGRHGAKSPPDMAFVRAFAAHDKVDILFVIANFAVPNKRAELRNRFPQLAEALQAATPASYHIGIITTDLGAGPFTYNSGQCHPDGDGAKLQAIAEAPGTPPAPAACSAFSLTNGARYIDWDLIAGSSNIVGVLDVPTAFDCMSNFSDGGCPFFQALEAAYRAVTNPPPENAGFLRDDALLVIVFLQDTDDCSAPIDSPVFDRTGDASFTPMHCARNNIACGNPPGVVTGDSGGPFDDCVPIAQADGGRLYDVQRYIDFSEDPAAPSRIRPTSSWARSLRRRRRSRGPPRLVTTASCARTSVRRACRQSLGARRPRCASTRSCRRSARCATRTTRRRSTIWRSRSSPACADPIS